MKVSILCVAIIELAGCRPSTPPPVAPSTPPAVGDSGSVSQEVESKPPHPQSTACGGTPLRVSFYDAGQALAALVTLPDGRHILVDAGESPTRPACGGPCRDWHNRVLAGLEKDLGPNGKIDLLWTTHPHSDHVGGVPGVAAKFPIGAFVYNGRDAAKSTVKKAIDAASADGATLTVVEPGKATVPLSTPEDVKLTAIVPDVWPSVCKSDPNDCSILLRIDYCASSILFTGDAEKDEESHLDARGEVTLLQVGHHGSDTSSTAEFIAQLKPKYAVISSGKYGEGTNKTYCHPIKTTVDTLNAAMGGVRTHTIRAFNGAASGVKCKNSKPSHWIDAPASDTLWATARDGNVVLTTTGDGTFVRESDN